MLRHFLVSTLLAVAAALPARAQSANVMIELVSLAGDTIRIGAAEWAQFPRDTVQAADPGGANHAPIRGVYAGVDLRALLTRAGVPEGTAVRGAALRMYVVAEATDGYRVLFSLAELEPSLTDAPVIVADHRDGAALEEHEGPLRIIAPEQKRPARWVRNLARLSIQQIP